MWSYCKNLYVYAHFSKADVRTADILSGCVPSTFSYVNSSFPGRLPHNHDLYVVGKCYILYICAPDASSVHKTIF